MSRRPKLGIDTDVWALMTAEGRPRGGDSKPHIYWTKAQAKRVQRLFPDCTVVAVRVVVRRAVAADGASEQSGSEAVEPPLALAQNRTLS